MNTRTGIYLGIAALVALSGCFDDDLPPRVEPDNPNNSANDAGQTTADTGTTEMDAGGEMDAANDAGGEVDLGPDWSAYAVPTEVVSQDQCAIGGDVIFVATVLPSDFPAESEINAGSVYSVGSPPPLYRSDEQPSFSVAWANTEGSSVHVVAGTAVVGTGATTIETPLYFTFNATTGVQVTELTVKPARGQLGTEPLYEVQLYTSDGVYACEARQNNSDQSIDQNCEPSTAFNDYVTDAGLAPIRRMAALPLLTEDNTYSILQTNYMFAGNGGTTDFTLGAVNWNILPGQNLNFPDFASRQDTPFFEHLVVGASTEANRVPYLMVLAGEGAAATPLVLAANEGISNYAAIVEDWALLPDFEAQPGTFAFLSSLDLFVEQETLFGPRIDTDATDAFFGYVGILSDGSLGFSRPSGFGDKDQLRLEPAEPVERVWAFDNFAWQQSPGEPIVFARTQTGALSIIRWDVGTTFETIPDALAGSGVDIVIDIKGVPLVNHNGLFALKVDRGGAADIAILPLESVRDFTDRICN